MAGRAPVSDGRPSHLNLLGSSRSRRGVLRQRTSAARPNPSGQWLPARVPPTLEPPRSTRGQAWRARAGPESAHRGATRRAARARACSIAASRSTSRPGSPMPRRSRRRRSGAGVCGARVPSLPGMRNPCAWLCPARCAQCGHDFLIAFSCKGRGVCRHLHFHCVVIDGVFEPAPANTVVFRAATGLDANAIAQVQQSVRRRLLRLFVRRGLLPQCRTGDGAMGTWRWLLRRWFGAL